MLIAIDPGAGGGIAWDHQGRVSAVPMPDTPTETYRLLRDLAATEPDNLCLMERVGTYVPGNSGPAAATFARHCGHLDMALIALGLPQLRPVTPAVWMRVVCGALPKDKGERKRAIKDLMQRRYPGLRVTLKTADALGLLTYLRGAA